MNLQKCIFYGVNFLQKCIFAGLKNLQKCKSGKDYTIHRALDRFVSNEDYHIQKALVLSNGQKVRVEGKNALSSDLLCHVSAAEFAKASDSVKFGFLCYGIKKAPRKRCFFNVIR